MAEAKKQTAIEGVFSVFSVNIATRFLFFVRHIVIATYIGLSGEFDAFCAALGATGIVVLVFGDIFDSIGVPRLVKARQEEGEAGVRRVAGNVIKVSILLSVLCSVLLLALAPWSSWIVPGFAPEQKTVMLRYIYLLIPMCLVYLPYHAMGSVLRSIREFRGFYIAELVSSVASLLLILMWHDDVSSVPIAWSAGYLFGSIYLVARLKGAFSLSGGWFNPEAKAIGRVVLMLLPSYMISQLYVLTDKIFGSYLPKGDISALYYGLMLAMILPTMLATENIFITPIAEAQDRGPILTKIVSGISLLSFPVALFTFAYSRDIVSILFERGMFKGSSVETTSVALRFYVLSLPAWSVWGTLARLFQVIERYKVITVVSAVGVLVDIAVNYVAIFHFGAGIKSLPIATAVTAWLLVLAALWMLSRHGVGIEVKKVVRTILVVVTYSAVSLAVVILLGSLAGNGLIAFLAKGIVYVAVYFVLARTLSNAWIYSLCEEIEMNVLGMMGIGKRSG